MPTLGYDILKKAFNPGTYEVVYEYTMMLDSKESRVFTSDEPFTFQELMVYIMAHKTSNKMNNREPSIISILYAK